MTPFTLIIGNKNFSSWSLRPWLVMKYFDIPFKEIIIPLRQPDTKAKILKYSPSGKVPVLQHGKLVLGESLPIAEYLAETFPKKNLWPADASVRARARAVAGEMYSSFNAMRQNFPMDVNLKLDKPSTPDADKDLRRIMEIWENCRKEFKKEGDFLFGNFSIADAMFAPVMFRVNSYGIKLTAPAKAYFMTMMALPAMKEWQSAAAKEKS